MRESAAELLLADAKSTLIRELNASSDVSSDEAFCSWLLPEDEYRRPPLRDLAKAATASFPIRRDYQLLATIGFALYEQVAAEDSVAVFCDGVDWLSKREPLLDATPRDFCTDVVALLGIALGGATVAETRGRVAEWLAKFLSSSYELTGIEDWQRCFFSAIQAKLSLSPELHMPLAPEIADVRVALRSKGIISAGDSLEDERDEAAALRLLTVGQSSRLQRPRVATRLSSLRWSRRAAAVFCPGRITVDDVCKFLRRVPAGLRRWTWEEKARSRKPGAQPRRWHIDNEYHVQDLLYFLLAPYLPDLTDEENFPSIGQKKPRVDLYVPSLKLIIEVKFVYDNSTFPGIIGQVAEDTGLYLSKQSRYTEIVALVWDNTRRVEQHDMLIRGLKELRGVRDAVVLSRPGRMIDSAR